MTNVLLETTIAISMRHVLQMETHSHVVVKLDSVATESAAKMMMNAAMEVITVMLILYAPMNQEVSNVNVSTDTLVTVKTVSTTMNVELEIIIVTNKLFV